jgi:hypothetical protein
MANFENHRWSPNAEEEELLSLTAIKWPLFPIACDRSYTGSDIVIDF